MGMVVERLNLRLFVDGIELPVIGAQCTYQESGITTAEIQVVATDEIYEIEPRAFVTLFVYDNYDYVPGPQGEPNKFRIGPQDLRRWKLMFSGELVAVSMNKRGASRAARLTCADITNYWDFIKQHYINFNNAGVELFEAAFLGISADRVKFSDVLTTGAQSKLFIWLTESTNAEGNPSLYLGVQRMLREMYFSVNDFYAEAFNRLRIGDQVVGLKEDETAAKLFKLQFFQKFIKNRVGGAGGQVSVRQLVDLLLGPVFHSYVTIPCPRFDRQGELLGFNVEESDIVSKIMNRPNSWPGATLNSTIIKPDTWFLAPPKCNIIFPHQYEGLSFSRNYLAEPTRLFLRTSLFFTGNDKWLTERMYAPDFASFNDLLYKQGGYLKRMAGTLLPHEQFVGINPIMAWEEDISAYVAKGPRREYLSQMSHYLFWKYKFGTRNVNVSGPLNLNLVPGFPGLVLDRTQKESGGITRHFQGHIQMLVHSVDQNGGWTHVTMTGARVHDEQVDFDDGGRSLEEVVARGTDGFLDDRYDPERIGPEVYQKLFGCGSIVDLVPASERTETITVKETVQSTRDITFQEANRQAQIYQDAEDTKLRRRATNDAAGNPLSAEDLAIELKAVDERAEALVSAITAGLTTSSEVPVEKEVLRDLVPLSVEKVVSLYNAARKEGKGQIFAAQTTNRPKANFLELMGVDVANVPPMRETDTYSYSNAALDLAMQQDPDLVDNDGFFATATNPQAQTTIEASYIASKKTSNVQVGKRTEEFVVEPGRTEFITTESEGFSDPESGESFGLEEINIPEVTQTIEVPIYEQRVDTSRAKYDLVSNLELRREKVKAYVDSIRFRGLRG